MIETIERVKKKKSCENELYEIVKYEYINDFFFKIIVFWSRNLEVTTRNMSLTFVQPVAVIEHISLLMSMKVS